MKCKKWKREKHKEDTEECGVSGAELPCVPLSPLERSGGGGGVSNSPRSKHPVPRESTKGRVDPHKPPAQQFHAVTPSKGRATACLPPHFLTP